MFTDSLTIVVGFATVVNAGALVYDVFRRHKKQTASFVQVTNKNDGGIYEFRTKDSANAKGIWIKSDGTVEIKRLNGEIEAYASFIRWKS